MASPQNNAAFALSIDLILCKVLKYVMWNRDRDFKDVETVKLNGTRKSQNLKDVRSLRLVSYHWLDATTRILRSENFPLFNITDESGSDLPIITTFGCLMNNDLYPADLDPNGSIRTPLFKFKLRRRLLHRRNRLVLVNCFTQLGSGLVELEFQFPIDVNSIDVTNFPPFELPRLQKLTVDLTEKKLNGRTPKRPGYLRRARIPVPTRSFQALLQLILNASHKLTVLRFVCFFRPRYYIRHIKYFPTNFTELILPPSLSQLQFDCSLWSAEEMELLIAPQNPLIQLTSLHLHSLERPGYYIAHDPQLVYQVLEKVQISLSHLKLHGSQAEILMSLPEEIVDINGEWDDIQNDRTQLRFPLMSKLKSLEVVSNRWTLPPDMIRLSKNLPMLETLSLENCLETEFQERWAHRSVYKSVKKLKLYLVQFDDFVEIQEDEQYLRLKIPWQGEETKDFEEEPQDLDMPYLYAIKVLSMTDSRMKLVHSTFPNVTDIHLTFELTISLAPGMAYMFTEMKALKHLHLQFSGCPSGQYNMYPLPLSHWDSVLTGLSRDEVIELRNVSIDELESRAEGILNGEGGGSNLEIPSIRNLVELETLVLACERSSNKRPVISHLSIFLGFLQMPKLKFIDLIGGFHPTREMQRLWNQWSNSQIKNIGSASILC